MSNWPRKSPPRTYRCRQCGAAASYKELQERPAASLKRDGRIVRFQQVTTTYWCDSHTGITDDWGPELLDYK